MAEAQQLYLWPKIGVCETPEEATIHYSAICASWGRMGGLSTLDKMGTGWFRALAQFRHSRISRSKLNEIRTELRAAARSEASG